MATSRVTARRRNLLGVALLLAAPSLTALAVGCAAQVLPVEIDGVDAGDTGRQMSDGGDSAARPDDAGQDVNISYPDSTVEAPDSTSGDAMVEAAMDSATSDTHPVDVVAADSGVLETSSPPMDSS